MDITEHNHNEETTILLTIGRMNPPTTGHLLLIKTMLEQALRENVSQINIILSHSQDTKTNPFHCDQKRNLLINDETIYQSPGQIPGQSQSMITLLKQQMMKEHPEQAPQIEKIAVQIVCMNDNVNPEYGKHPIMKSITYILNDLYGYPREGLTIKLFVGQDRVNDYGWIKKYLETLEPNAVAMEIVGLPRPDGAMSATKMRQYALSNNWEEFKSNMASTELDEVVVRYMFDEIRANMKTQQLPPPTLEPQPQPQRKKRKTKGGKRRKTTKRKRRKTKRKRKNVNIK